tara:strand:- start:1311 stop:1838 length:528 start_codon:yes stop_codon:yes gene_type:complete
MFKRSFILLSLILIFSTNNKLLAEEKIVFIDINYIFVNSSAGKKINQQIQEKRKKNNDTFNEFKKKVESDKKKLSTQKNVIAKDEYEKKIFELEKKIKDYNLDIRKKNDELLALRNKARLEFLKNLNVIVQKFSKDNSISMVLKKDNIFIGKTDLDMTSNILALFDKKIKKITIK